MVMPAFEPPAEMPDDGQFMPEGIGPEGMPPEAMGMLPQQPQEEIASPAVMTGNGEPNDHQKLIAWIDHPNIAKELDETELGVIGQRVIREYQLDLTSRQAAGWEDRAKVATDLAMQVAKEKTYPWPRASNIIYPLMTTAAVQFAARAYPAIVQGRNVVKGVVVGPDNGIPRISPEDGTPLVQMGPDGQPQPLWEQPPGSKRDRAKRIGEHMSWQLLSEMKEWEEETDKLLHILPIVGCHFRKSYFNPSLGCNQSVSLMAMNVVVNYWTKSLERAPRISEEMQLYPQEIEENVRAGLFLEHEYGLAEGAGDDEDAPHDFIDQHRLLDLDDDGYSEPYIVTVHKKTGKVARIVARYDADGVHINRNTGKIVRIDPVHYFTKYDFLPSFDGGFYGTGFGQLLGPINEAVNTSINMMFDAGHLQTVGGGFVGRGLSMHSGAVRFKPGEYKVVNAPGSTVRDSVVHLEHPGPSAVLMALLTMLIEAGKEVASVKDALTGDMAASTQPTTLLAMIEQGLKVFTAIYKRVHRSAKHEYDKLFRLNRIYMEHQARYQVGDEWKTVTKEDYAKSAGVEPVSDPAMVSDMQKMARTQFLMGFANDPMMNGMEIRKEALTNAQIEQPERFLNAQPPQNPAMLAKMAEMELEGHKTEATIATEKVKQIEIYTRAILNLANADKVVDDQRLGWIEQHIELYRAQMESLMQPKEPKEGGALSPQGMPAPPPGLPRGPAMAPPLPIDQAAPEMSFHNAPFARRGAPGPVDPGM